jgi:DNA-binding NarL/FixJ family response regulator
MTQSLPKQNLLKILIVDDREVVLRGTVGAIRQEYPRAEILEAQTTQNALEKLCNLAVVDLSLPVRVGDNPKTDAGISLLRTIMEKYPTLNIVVQSADTRHLKRLQLSIYEHKGGFTIADKSLTIQEMLTRVDWSSQGLIFIPQDMRHGLELKQEWLTLLELAFQEGLQDREIARKMQVSDRTVRHYWTRIQDMLGVYPDSGKNIRVQTGIRAREEGLID